MAQNIFRNGSFEKRVKDPVPVTIRAEGMPIYSDWINADTFRTISLTDCPVNVHGNRFSICKTDSSSTNNICGDYSALPANYYFKSLNGERAIANVTGSNSNLKGIENYWPTKFIAQQFTNPLIKGHQYYFYMFYNMDVWVANYSYNINAHHSEYYQVNTLLSTNIYGMGLSMDRPMHIQPLNVWYRQIENYKEYRKARFTANHDTAWQAWRTVLTADSAYQYFTFGTLWDPDESTFVYDNQYPIPNRFLSGVTNAIQIGMAYDSFNLWDVTLKINADSLACLNTTLPLKASYYSRGDSCKWFNKNGQSLGVGDSISIRLEQDTWVFCEKYFPEIEFLQKDSLLIKTNKAGPSFKVSRTGDVCTLPAHLWASPPDLNYFWEGKTDTTSYYIAPNAGSINLHVTDNAGCKTDTVIQVDAPMQFSSQLVGDSCKLPISINLLPTSYQYSWNGVTSNPLNINQTGNVLLQAMDNKGCKKDTTLFLVSPPNFSINYVIDSCMIPTLIGFAPTQLQYSSQNTPIANPFEVEKSKSYTIEARNAWNCVATKSITVPDCEALAAKNVYIPNAFTPNSNFLNEGFFPVGLGIKTYQINIYSRWGEQLFAGAANQEWQAMNYQDGVYLYQITINFKNGSIENFAGEVHLLR